MPYELTWCTEKDVRGALSDLDSWLKNLEPNITDYIRGASGEAASYLGRYRKFFLMWNGGQAPPEVAGAVASIAVKDITGANASLSPGSVDKTFWEREYERTTQWLQDVRDEKAEIYYMWPGLTELQQDYGRAAKYILTPPGVY